VPLEGSTQWQVFVAELILTAEAISDSGIDVKSFAKVLRETAAYLEREDGSRTELVEEGR
jgi:hypothetical protein